MFLPGIGAIRELSGKKQDCLRTENARPAACLRGNWENTESHTNHLSLSLSLSRAFRATGERDERARVAAAQRDDAGRAATRIRAAAERVARG